MTYSNANKFIKDLLEDRRNMRESLAQHFNGQPFRVEDLTMAAQVLGYTFTADDFRRAYHAAPQRRRELNGVLKDEMGWTEPDWIR